LIKDEKARFQMVRARSGLIAEAPFFGTLSLKFILKEDYSCKTTMWTDGVHLGYNPEFVHQLTIGKIRGVVCHECMHCACMHHTRRGDRKHEKWNEAGDYAINPLVLDAGFRLPEGLIDPKFKGMSAEEIYARLPDPSDGADNGCGEVRDCPNPEDSNQPATESQKREQEVDWELTIRQAKNQANAEGKMPASVKEMVDNILKPKVDWRVVLLRFIEKITRNDYQWIPPNRRFVHMGIYLPSMFCRELSPGVLIIDASGSTLSDRQQFGGELNGVLESYSTTLTVIYVDTKVQGEPQIYTREDLPITMLEMRGGGGTRFTPAFEWIEKHYDGTPGFAIYLTDLECSDYPANPPDYPVLWVKTPNGQGDDPPWGELVHMGVN